MSLGYNYQNLLVSELSDSGLSIAVFSSGYGCKTRILGPFLIDTEDTDAKWHMLQAVCCFIKRSRIHSVIL